MSNPLVEPGYGLGPLLSSSLGGRQIPVPLTSLAAATTGTGTVLDCGAVFANPWMLLSAPATPGAGAVILEGSMDNVVWYTIHATTTVPDTTTVMVNATVPARFLRARVTTTVTTTTATAVIGAI